MSELAGRFMAGPVIMTMKGLFPRVFLKTHDLLRTYFVGFDKSAWIVLVKSEISMATGMAWPVRSDRMERKHPTCLSWQVYAIS